jgi:tripartite-type tricarboxylate transporter receptor subunit TctC
VPYRGNAPLVVDLLAAGEGPHSSPALNDGACAGGLLKALPAFRWQSVRRSQRMPTIAESGFPGFRIENYSVMLAPAGIPEPIATLLERANWWLRSCFLM